MAGSQLAALRGRVDAKRAGGGEGGEGSDEEDLEVHGDGVLVMLGLMIVFFGCDKVNEWSRWMSSREDFLRHATYTPYIHLS